MSTVSRTAWLVVAWVACIAACGGDGRQTASDGDAGLEDAGQADAADDAGADDAHDAGPGGDDVADAGTDAGEDAGGDAGDPGADPGCVAECAGKECGPDGCGRSCGTCLDGAVCEEGRCVCASRASLGCHQDNLWWFDSCGAPEEVHTDCVPDGLACHPDLLACTSGLANDARFVSQQVPPVMGTGERAAVQLTMRNVGTAAWSEAEGHRLGSQNPQDNGTWGTGRVYLPAGASVAPGGAHTFVFEAQAPGTPGVYDFQWRMLQEQVEWFGQATPNVSVAVESSDITVCEALRPLAGTQNDASAALQACIDATPAAGVLEVPAGIFRIDHQVRIHARPIVLRTEGANAAAERCAPDDHGCAELRASAAFGDTGGILQVQADGSVVDHLVIHGNKAGRQGTPSAVQCSQYNNAYGHNMRMTCNGCTLSNSVTRDALCGTGCEVAGAGSGVTVTRNTIANNGVHDAEGMWADGLTVHEYADSTFTHNQIFDNTDVDLIFGACVNCMIQDNTIWHADAFSQSSFAAMMIHTWPGQSGDYTGADVSGNTIDCGSSKRCGFGLLLGSDAWYVTDVHGGSVHHNTVRNAQQGVLIDDVHDMAVYDNPVEQNGWITQASCGARTTTSYSVGSRTYNLDTSQDTLGTTYHQQDWDGCIPNWWNQ